MPLPSNPLNPPNPADAHGTRLTERAIASVEADPHRLVLDHNKWAGPWIGAVAEPVPGDTLAAMVFPSGRPLPPSLRRWLAFDAGLLRRYGWFDAGLRFTPRTLGRLARDEFGDGWGAGFDTLSARFDECFLLPGGSDSRRVLATGEADEYGEYPVFALDVDDLPCVELMYPGLDVHLADTAGVISRREGGYSSLAEDATYGPRMRTHARNAFAGELHQICLPE
ncbi:hypothetical protein [Streptomyces liangshanensis]|uniref:Uncharacterized protein n=1 Tax=Streptomyces liangshanensis TaxID=2717324 RepID=A0A6G9H0H3_9ACTN|nr:hypothetical protein [Streptomyces liangshanensis]QIQ03627.1 hypothetical protein HA039_15965 [Streptomyces liangshanensis]